MSDRAVPFFCPYCGEETLRPQGDEHGEWRCESCLRAFVLRAVRRSAPETAASSAAGPA